MNHTGVSTRSGIVPPSKSTCPLRSLSDRELLSRVKDLVSRERAVTLEILVHLIEVERRRLHLGLGYASMFEYATRHLGYSESAAARRIRVARCLRDYPVVRRFLEKNEVNLVTISMVASILTKGNARDVIANIRGKSQREVEAVAATYSPPVSMRDRATPVCVAVPEGGISQLVETQTDRTATGGSKPAADFVGGPPQATSASQAPRQAAVSGVIAGPSGAGTEAQAPRQASTQPSDEPTAPRLEARFLIQFLASPRFMKKLERAKALLSNKNGALSHESVLEAALDEFLKDHDPEERKQRREERKEKVEARTKAKERAATKAVRSQSAGSIRGAGCGQVDGPSSFSDRAGGGPVSDPASEQCIVDRPASRVRADGGGSRLIPAAVRDAVFARDEGRCTYVGSNGERCAATHHLQIDHLVPFARGGRSTIGNLRLLCERHNKHEAERVLGENRVRRFRRRE